MRAAGELCVLGTLAAGEARDACFAVARTKPMRRGELVDTKNALSGFGKLIERGRAHRAEADHDGVVARGHGTSELGAPTIAMRRPTKKRPPFGGLFVRS